MKKFTLLSALMVFCASEVMAQVGINTVAPTATFDVNGTTRIRALSNTGVAKYVLGVDDAGNIVRLALGDNVFIENNVIKASDNNGAGRIESRAINATNAIISGNVLSDMNLGIVILPGGIPPRLKVYQIDHPVANDFNLTGMQALPDGTIVWLQAKGGDMEIRANDSRSLPANRFLPNTELKIKENHMAAFIYDASISKWVMMSHIVDTSD